MQRLGHSPSTFSRRSLRRPALSLEFLESRQVLSVGPTGIVLQPSLDTADLSSAQGGDVSASVTNPNPASTSLTPSQIASAYGINFNPNTGNGITVAIVGAYNNPNIASDLAVFSSKYGLPAANLTVVNQSGQTTGLPPTDAGWSLETAMDVEWVHATAPGAKIVLVEANSSSLNDMVAAVQTAAKMANVVSMSWGGSEFRGETAYDTAAYFANPNVTFVAASGDDGGAAGAEWPAVSPDVVSVGGTTLRLTSSGSISSETAWNASGSWWTGYSGSAGGASRYEPLPSFQSGVSGASTTRRSTPDVAADANPSTGVAVYDSVSGLGQTGWFQVGGTSAGAPIWSGILAGIDQALVSAGKAMLNSSTTLSLLYNQLKSGSASYAAAFHDITSGANFAASAKAGYDMVTGLGSPIASRLLALATGTATPLATTTTTTTTHTTTTTPRVALRHNDVVAVAAPTTAHSAPTSNQVTIVSLPSSAPVVAVAVAQDPNHSPAPVTVVDNPSGAARVNQSTRTSEAARSSVLEDEVATPANWTEPALETELVEPSVPLPDVSAAAPTDSTSALVPNSWDDAIEAYIDETLPVLPVGFDPGPALPVGFDEPLEGSRSAVLVGAAAAAWAAWRLRSRRSDEKGRRGWRWDSHEEGLPDWR